MSRYRETVLLPKTSFPMKAGLAQREPELLARWEKMDLYASIQKVREGAQKFILHDGPPFANGNVHIHVIHLHPATQFVASNINFLLLRRSAIHNDCAP